MRSDARARRASAAASPDERRLERVFADVRKALSDETIPVGYRAFGARLLGAMSDASLSTAVREEHALRVLAISTGPFAPEQEQELEILLPPRKGALPNPDDTPFAAAPRRTRRR